MDKTGAFFNLNFKTGVQYADINRIDTARQVGGETMIKISPAMAKGMGAAQERHQAKREEILSLYRKAVAVIKEKNQWCNGETLSLYDGIIRDRKARVWIKNESGRLLLTLFREGPTGRLDKRFYGKPLLVGLLKPDVGWAFCGENEYLAWNRQVRKAMEGA